MFFFPFSKWVGGIFFEHTHRLIASLIGFLTIVLAVWLWRAKTERWLKTLGWLALGAVILQGVLGGLRVTLLKDEIGIFHACLAQAFLGLIVLIAIATTDFWRTLNRNSTVLNGQVHERFRRAKQFAIVATTLIYVQLALGATMRHQHKDLAILDFPTANGAWIPDTSAAALTKINAWRDARALSDVDAVQIWLQMAHRFLAVLIGVGVITFATRIRQFRKSSRAPILSGLSIWWVVMFFLQFTLGAWTVWSNKAADIATAHVAVGAIMLSFGVTAWALCSRILQPATQ